MKNTTNAPAGSLPRRVRPKTDLEWAAYRCTLSCKIGRDAIERKGLPDGLTPTEYALFNLLHAVEDLAKAIGPNDQAHRQTGAETTSNTTDP